MRLVSGSLSFIALLAPAAGAQTPQPKPAVPAVPAVPTVTVPAPPSGSFLGGGDDCATPTPISGEGFFLFDSSNATTGTEGQNESLCYFFGASTISNDVWFSWTADNTGCAIVTTCSLTAVDTKIAAYPDPGGCPIDGTALACSDDVCSIQSTMGFLVEAGSTYLIQIGAFPGAAGGTGQFDLTFLSCEPSISVHYKLDETSGTQVVDSGPNGLNGFYGGGYTLGQPGPDPGTATCVEFDDTQMGHGAIPDNLPLTGMIENVSVSAWIYPESTGASGIMRIFGNSDAWSCGITGTGLRFTTLGIVDYDQAVSIPLNAWSQVAFVFSHTHDVAFYLNGQNIGSVIGAAPSNFPSPEWRIGSLNATTEYWDGKIDDIQIYTGQLDDEDVEFLYENPGAVARAEPGTAYCFGDGTGSFCPCGNPGGPGEGCANGSGGGCLLSGEGFASISNDTLVMVASNALPNQPGLFFQGVNAINGGNGILFGDGLRCCGMNVVRLITVAPDGSGCAASDTSCGTQTGGQGGPISQHPTNVAQGLSAGDTRCYQFWYRDPQSSLCGFGFNLSNGYEVTWSP